jgi:hypothetical protein
VSSAEIADYRHTFSELQSKLAYVSRKQEEIEQTERALAAERAALQRERARVEKDKVIAVAELANEELLNLRKKYQSLKQRYKEEKQQWEEERRALLEKVPIPPVVEKPAKPPAKKSGQRKSNVVMLHDGYPLDFSFDPGQVLREEVKEDGRKLVRYRNGLAATVFKNGTRKMKVEKVCYVFYANGDIAIEFEDGARGYRYGETKAVELNLPDKSTFIEFTDGQREEHLPNGEKTVRYPNGQVKIFHANGDFELRDPSGRVEKCEGGRLRLEFAGLAKVA